MPTQHIFRLSQGKCPAHATPSLIVFKVLTKTVQVLRPSRGGGYL